MTRFSLCSAFFWFLLTSTAQAAINRHAIVSQFNPIRNASNLNTPMQVGNGGFAFGADVTGLQTFLPFAIMSSWGWMNDSFPPGKTLEDIENYQGVSWDSHGRPVEYLFGGEPAIEQWLFSNPNRANLGRVGLLFRDSDGSMLRVAEENLTDIHQELDLWSGTITSSFAYNGVKVTVRTYSAQSSSTVGVQITSSLIESGHLGVFLDFPWIDGTASFSAPYVGIWNATNSHTTSLKAGRGLGGNVQAEITHTLVNNTFTTSVGGDLFKISRDSLSAHRYSLLPSKKSETFSLAIDYSPDSPKSIPTPSDISHESEHVWETYWRNSGFIDVATGSTDTRARELQRRIILSRYLMRVNEAGDAPPQESGLVNNGWHGKFHMEMAFWHLAHWALWDNWDLLDRPLTAYSRFLTTSLQRAQKQQGYQSGARWSKMTDPSGRSAPGDTNELLIWQQPHPLVFAEYEYRATKSKDTLQKWLQVVNETANWMAEFAWFNSSTGKYDLGPPMYLVSEDAGPNVTRNPAFELAYWRHGLDLAETWLDRLDEPIPEKWSEVKANLAPLPIENGLYAIYEGLEDNFWTDPAYINTHPALVGLHGWLPLTANVDLEIAKATADKVYTSWNFTNCWGWDYPMLAMSAARNGETEKAMDLLLHPLFKFDDVGMPVSGVRVPTPYFPGSGGLLYAVAMMAAGWDQNSSTNSSPGFPLNGWNVRSEGIKQAM
ncbi:hypothetical protein QCA50_006118 [Cerrena zonata]|uniref:Six-hairpin glycosidase-like protein n=1 Tax=Cerrena zonata TaxID=2478898 RepID=A0AAW0GP64_9APHY